MRDIPYRIDNYAELADLLDRPFVLFAGSAVSAARLPRVGKKRFLPMVSDVTEFLFLNLGEVAAEQNTSYSKTLSAYARALVLGKHLDLRETIKFEEFLWRIERAIGQSLLVEFLHALFFCEEQQFNYNHAAIAMLLEEKKLEFCITTNFDNAVERASKGKLHKPYSVGKEVRLPLQKNSTLIKLHGDVVAGSYVATTPKLFQAEQSNEYSFLVDLLAGKNILFVGYSGNGDVDIAPHLEHLSETGAHLIWMVGPNGEPNPVATHYFQSDLWADDPDRNWLLKLSDMGAEASYVGYSAPDWKKRVADWVSGLSTEEVAHVLERTFEGSRGWAYLHLYHLGQWRSDSALTSSNPDSCEHLADSVYANIQVSAYKTALTIYRGPIIAQDCLKNAILQYYLSFTLWRVGNFDQSLKVMEWLLVHSDQHEDPTLERCLRTYVEIFSDKVRTVSSLPLRRSLYLNSNCPVWLRALDTITHTDAKEELLADVASARLRYLVGDPLEPNELSRIYRRSKDLQIWICASRAGQIMLHFDFGEGLKYLWEVNGLYGQRPQVSDANERESLLQRIMYIGKVARQFLLHPGWNTMVKDLAAILDSIPRLGRFQLGHFIDGPFVWRIKLALLEFRYAYKKRRWRMDFYSPYKEPNIE